MQNSKQNGCFFIQNRNLEWGLYVYDGKTQALSGKEFQVMEMLMQNRGVIVTAEQLITHIWGWNTDVDTSVVYVHVSNIRKKLDALSAPVAIKFVRNAGYILEATV